MNPHRRIRILTTLATCLCTLASAQGPARQGMRPGMIPTGGPTVGDPVPRIEPQRLDRSGDVAKPGGGIEPLADHAKKRPVVLIFSSFT